MSTRSEHLAQCKTRALKILARGDINGALTSMMSELDGHPETRDHAGNDICIGLMMIGALSTAHEAERFINGYN